MAKRGPYGRSRKRSKAAVQKACVNKQRYPTSEVARRYANELGFDIYPCVRCGGWHLTSHGRGERVALLSAHEQALLICAREGPVETRDGYAYDEDGREICGMEVVQSLVRKRLIRLTQWGEVVPRRPGRAA